jgi:hypothetical protein
MVLSKKQKKEIHELAIKLEKSCPQLENELKRVGKTIKRAHGD